MTDDRLAELTQLARAASNAYEDNAAALVELIAEVRRLRESLAALAGPPLEAFAPRGLCGHQYTPDCSWCREFGPPSEAT